MNLKLIIWYIFFVGLAHFLEHMLFLGTKKYPDASQFDQHLSDHAGYSNAYTSLDQTNYYFHCANNGFKEALDRYNTKNINRLCPSQIVEQELNDLIIKYVMCVDSRNSSLDHCSRKI